MSTSVVTAEPEVELRKGRRIAFYITVGLTFVALAVTGPALTLPITAWFPESTLHTMFGQEGLGIHRVHLEGASLLFWLTIIALVAQFRHPERRVAPLLAAAAAWVVFLPLELTHLVDPFSVVVTVLVVTAVALHPRRWPNRPIGWKARSTILAVPWAVLGLIYGSQQAMDQINGLPGDPHVDGSHFALVAALAVGLSVSALLGSSNAPGHTIAAWTTGLMALSLGIFFIGHPNQTSSLGIGWGVAIAIWGVTYVLLSMNRPAPVTGSRTAA